MTVLLRDAHQAEPAADAGGRPGVRPRRAVRQHRPRQQLHPGRPIALATCDDRGARRPGFGADIGVEKFFDIKCRASRPAARRGRAGRDRARAEDARRRRPGSWPASRSTRPVRRENIAAVRAGLRNLAEHIEIVRMFGVPVVVAINRFPTDTPARDRRRPRGGPRGGGRGRPWRRPLRRRRRRRRGTGRGGLGRGVRERCADFALLYPDDLPDAREDRGDRRPHLRRVGRRLLPLATRADRHRTKQLGFGRLPICMAKTHLSLSARSEPQGRPTGFRVPDPGRAALGRGGVRHAAPRRDADHARAAVPPGRRDRSTSTKTGEIVGLF